MDPHSGLNNLDYIVIGIVILSGLLALMRGFVRELFSLIAWIGAYFAAVKFYPLVFPTAHHYIKSDKGAEWAAMGAVFVGALILLMILGHLVCGLVKGKTLTTIDRSLGFVYGLARGILVVSLVYLGVVTVMWHDIDAPPSDQQQDKDRSMPPDLLMQAKTRPLLNYFAKNLKDILPKEIIDQTIKGAEEEKEDAEKGAKQKMLDRLSTPAPPILMNTDGRTDGNPNPAQGNKP